MTAPQPSAPQSDVKPPLWEHYCPADRAAWYEARIEALARENAAAYERCARLMETLRADGSLGFAADAIRKLSANGGVTDA